MFAARRYEFADANLKTMKHAQEVFADAEGRIEQATMGQPFVVEVTEGGEVASVAASPAQETAPAAAPAAGDGDPLPAPLAGNIVRVAVAAGDPVSAGDVVLTLEAMKMETEVRAPRDGTVVSVAVAAGDAVHVGDTLLVLG